MTPRAPAARPRGLRAFAAPRSASVVAAAAAIAIAIAGFAGASPQPSATGGFASAASDRAAAVRLRGLMRIGERAVALLEFGGGRPRRVQPGETVSGWTLLRVESARVVLESPTGEPVEVGLAEPSAAAAERSSAHAAAAGDRMASVPDPANGPAARGGRDAEAAVAMEAEAMAAEGMSAEGMSEPGPAPPVSSVSSVSRAPASGAGGERRFSRDEVRLRLATELPRILTGATVAPRIDGDEVVGLELVSFPTDTILGETGLLPNDVLLRVNDREVRGVESLAVLVQRFQTASRIELAVERGGEVVSLRYAIE